MAPDIRDPCQAEIVAKEGGPSCQLHAKNMRDRLATGLSPDLSKSSLPTWTNRHSRPG
jgi:hypothetical protein